MLQCWGPLAGIWPLLSRWAASLEPHRNTLWWWGWLCYSEQGNRCLRPQWGEYRCPGAAAGSQNAESLCQRCCLEVATEDNQRIGTFATLHLHYVVSAMQCNASPNVLFLFLFKSQHQHNIDNPHIPQWKHLLGCFTSFSLFSVIC